MEVEPFLALAGKLLAMESTADRPDELHRALGFVLDFVGAGFTVERFESGGRPSALVYAGGERPRFGVILNAHLDVVPGQARQFQPRREGGHLHARGAQDMKVSGLVMALAFRESSLAGCPTRSDCSWSRTRRSAGATARCTSCSAGLPASSP